MIINSNLSKYIVFAEDDVLTALKKMSAFGIRIIFAVSESGVLEGILTDGDIRRWLVEQENIDLSVTLSSLVNRDFAFARTEDSRDQILAKLDNRIEFLPVIDKYGHLISIASKRFREFEIANRPIGDGRPTFIIAEIGNNHNGCIKLAKKLVDLAHEAGVDCAKFQMRNLETLYSNKGNSNDDSEDLGSQYTLDLLSKFQLSEQEMLEVLHYTKEKGLVPLCTPWDIESLDTLNQHGIPAFKFASADLTNQELLKAASATGKPLICSTGMSTENEIVEATRFLESCSASFCLLHCNSTYPTPYKDINLNYLHRLKKIGQCPVGYSGHERGYEIPIAAVAMGASVIEKHFTIDRAMEGNDHKVSLLPDELTAMVKAIRNLEEAKGSEAPRTTSQGELINREALAKSLVVNQSVKSGTQITEEMLEVRSPGKGLQPNKKSFVIGKSVRRDLKCGDFLFESDFSEIVYEPKPFSFGRPWGIPVRYHDLKKMLTVADPDFIEFHLSYKDLEAPLEKYFDDPIKKGFVVHCPELFAGDHLLDLCAKDDEYRYRSIQELGRVCDITRKLREFFPEETRPMIVTNVGGFSRGGFIPKVERDELYAKVVDSIAKVDTTDVEVIPQTMPPFPWHFGGQSYHNLFVDPDEIVDFCSSNDFRICADLSHSMLACNYYKASFHGFVRSIGPYIAHLHLADAEGHDGEGLQIGKGMIDFVTLGKDLDRFAPDAPFIPEIWQGHTNNGEGFWEALHKLENCFGDRGQLNG